MTDDTGEVAVRTGSTNHALKAPGLDGKRLEVDLGGDHPVARVPSEVAVEYRDEPVTDGGALARPETEVSLRGLTLDDDDVTLVLAGAMLALAASGYAWGVGEAALALVAGGAGVGLLKLGVMARAGGWA